MAGFPRQAFALAALVLLMFPSVASLPGLPWQPPAERREIRFALGAFDPLLDALPDGAALDSRGAEGPFVVQFSGRAGAAAARGIAEAGGAVVAVLGGDAFVVSGSAGLARALDRLPGVRWVGAVPPSMRLHPDAARSDLVAVSYVGAPQALLDALSSAGAAAAVVGQTFALARPGVEGAPAVARLPNVLFVAPYTPPSLQNYRATITDHIRQATNDSAYSASGGALWAFNGNPTDPRFVGYTGDGVRVDVTDQGVDGSHPAFSGRLGPRTTWSGVPAGQDLSGHGTHVAATALGNGSYLAADGPLAPGLYAGAAPGATLVAQNFNAAAMNYSAMAAFAAGGGATISVNAWGDSSGAALGAYTAAAAEYDALTVDASSSLPGGQPLLFVFAAGNEMNAQGSVISPSTAKNVLTVGAVGNDYPGLSTSDEVALFSSFGPTDDGRLKPDLVAPGEMVASARSSQGPGGTGTLPPLGGTSYVYFNGTSHATPQVGGAAAVATQYLRDARAVSATPALLKALFINGATPLPGLAWPSPAQGWGRLDLGASLIGNSTARVDFIEEGFANFTNDGPLDYVQIPVALDAGEEFKVTLVWTDPPNSPLAPLALWNDLDLEVRDPTGSAVFEGNRFNASTGFSEPGPAVHFDSANNTEVVRIAAAAAGNWSVFVRSYRFVNQTQTFALAFSGALNRTQADLRVEALALSGNPPRIESGASIQIDGDLLNRGGSAASEVVVEAWDAGDALAPPFANATFPSLGPGGRTAFALSFVPPDGGNEIEVRARFASADADPSDNAATVAFFVTRFEVQITGAAESAGRPGEDATFALLLTNAGNAADTISLAEDPAQRDPLWTFNLTGATASLAPGESAPFLVSIRVPVNASTGDSTLAKVVGTSLGNASRSASIVLTARAGAAHALGVMPAVPSFSAQAGFDQNLTVNVTNLGNGPEDVLVTLAGDWPSSDTQWAFGQATFTLLRGATRILNLQVSNRDTGDAGYRGLLHVRAELVGSGEVFEGTVTVVVAARPCLAFDPVPVIATHGGTPTLAPIALRNCGNLALEGLLTYDSSHPFAVAGPFDFNLTPGNTAFLDVSVIADDTLVDGNYTVRYSGVVAGGLTAFVDFVVRHKTPVDLGSSGPQDAATFAYGERYTTAVLRYHNRGGAGPVVAPLVAGLPPGWRATMQPDVAWVGAGQDITFNLTLDRDVDLAPKEVTLHLLFYPFSARQGTFTSEVRAVGNPPPPPTSPGEPASPSSAVAALAVALGAAGALLAAALVASVLRPQSTLPRTCPACGHKAPRFDTLLNPLCGRCGEGLEPKPPA